MTSSRASVASEPNLTGLASAAARVRDYPASRLVQEFSDPAAGDWRAILVIEHRQTLDGLPSRSPVEFSPVQEDALLDIRKRMERELASLRLLQRELFLLRSGTLPLSGSGAVAPSQTQADRSLWTETRPMAPGWYWHSRGPSWWRHGPIAVFVDEEQSVWAPGQTERIPLMFLDDWEGLWLGPFDGPRVSAHRLDS